MNKTEIARIMAELRRIWREPAPVPKLEPRCGSCLNQGPVGHAILVNFGGRVPRRPTLDS